MCALVRARPTVLAALVGAACALAAPAAAPRRVYRSRDPRLPAAGTLAQAGSQSGAYVYDVTARRMLFAQNPDVARPPASVEKLYTSTTALDLFGPDARLQTTVLGAGSLDSHGVFRGTLYLRGGGDPTFGNQSFIDQWYGSGNGASVSALVEELVRRGIRSVDGPVLGDESLFDALRGGPTTDYAPDSELEGQLSALAFDRGQAGSQTGPHAPAAYAAQMLVAAMEQAHIHVSGPIGAGVTPPGATPLAAVASPPLATLLRLMDAPSDNYFAETLLKDLGAYYGGAAPPPTARRWSSRQSRASASTSRSSTAPASRTATPPRPARSPRY